MSQKIIILTKDESENVRKLKEAIAEINLKSVLRKPPSLEGCVQKVYSEEIPHDKPWERKKRRNR